MSADRAVAAVLLLLPLALAACPRPDDPPPAGHTGTEPPAHTGAEPHETGPGTDTSPPCDPVTAFAASLGDHDLEARFSVDLAAPGDAFVACTSAAEPLERHLVESSRAAAHQELVLRGLLAGTTYTCVARATCGGAIRTADVTTRVPAGVPALTSTRTPGETPVGAYTLFNEQLRCGPEAPMYVGIVDPDARLRWLYLVGYDLVLDIDAQVVDAETVHVGGGWGTFKSEQGNRGVFRDVDLSGRTLLNRSVPDFGLGFNHHSEALADGTYLSLTGDLDTNGAREWIGLGVELWHPTEGVVWTWDSRALALAGEVFPPQPSDPPWLPSPYHANAANLVSDALGDALWLSIYGYKELWRIDRATGERTHLFGAGGDFTLVDPSGTPLPDSEYPWVQHGVEYAPDGRILAYDNGVDRPGGSYSRVVEYHLDLPALRATRLWSWTEGGWYDPTVGDADYLADGHVLVTQAYSPCAQNLVEDVSEIVELRPPDTVVQRITWPNSSWGVYRSQRYDGCAVFSNARYCDTVAARWSELGLE